MMYDYESEIMKCLIKMYLPSLSTKMSRYISTLYRKMNDLTFVAKATRFIINVPSYYV